MIASPYRPSPETIARFSHSVKPAPAYVPVPSSPPEPIRRRQPRPEFKGMDRAAYMRAYQNMWRKGKRKRHLAYYEFRAGANLASLSLKYNLPLNKIENIIRQSLP